MPTTPKQEILYFLIGDNIRRFRIERKLALDDLGKAAGLSAASVSNIEAGRQHSSLSNLYAMAEVLGKSIYDILPAELPEAKVSLNEMFAEFVKEKLNTG